MHFTLDTQSVRTLGIEGVTGHLRARRSSALVPPSFGPPAVSRSDVRRPLPPRWELVAPPPEVVDDVRLQQMVDSVEAPPQCTPH